jgi:CheY-like chemotaxis protein
MNGSRILVAEDDGRLAATLDRLLTAEGHHIEVVGDGLQALRLVREQPFDLVVLDVMLPSLDGVGVCRRLRATAQVPILMLTALGGTDERVRGLDAGADDYLVKPFAIAGEVFMLGLGLASLLLALATCLLAIGILWRRSRARRWAVRLEVTCLAGSLLLLLLPIGANHGPVALMTNVALPIALIVLLRKPREAFT